VIVHNLDIGGASVGPAEAYSELVVHANAVIVTRGVTMSSAEFSFAELVDAFLPPDSDPH
jgi:hypothetical protein